MLSEQLHYFSPIKRWNVAGVVHEVVRHNLVSCNRFSIEIDQLVLIHPQFQLAHRLQVQLYQEVQKEVLLLRYGQAQPLVGIMLLMTFKVGGSLLHV